MLTKNDTMSAVVETWLADLEQALAAARDADLRALFLPDCHWRDVLALTWTIQTLDGRDAVVSALAQCAARARPNGFRIAENGTPPRRVRRAGIETIEAIVAFETDRTAVRNISLFATPSAWPKRASSAPSAAPAIRTTTHSRSPSSVSTRRR